MRFWAMMLEVVFEHEQLQQAQALASDLVAANPRRAGQKHCDASNYAYFMSHASPRPCACRYQVGAKRTVYQHGQPRP